MLIITIKSFERDSINSNVGKCFYEGNSVGVDAETKDMGESFQKLGLNKDNIRVVGTSPILKPKRNRVILHLKVHFIFKRCSFLTNQIDFILIEVILTKIHCYMVIITSI